MSHLYYHRSDSERLHKHLYLARECSGKVNTAGFRNVAQCGYISFPGYEYSHNRPVYYRKCGGGETKKLRLADYSETDKRTADKDFVGQRVYHSPEFARDVQSSGDGAIDHIGQARNDKDNKGDIKKERFALGIKRGCVENHNKENDS